jgi:hypothetical protein
MQKWILFDWLLAIVPAFLVAFAFWMRRQNFHISDILGDGQLFFFCAALAASMFGDLSELGDKLSESQKNDVKLCEVGIVFVILFSSFAFGAATQAPANAKSRVAETSLWLSVATSFLVFWMRSHFHTW